MTARESFARAYEKVRRGYGYTESAGGVGIFTLPSLSALPFVRHGFTARTGGVSEGPLSSLNLSFSRGIEPRERTMENYRILAAAAGFSEESMIMDTYEHGVTVRRVDRRDCGAGYTLPPLPPCDALVTDDPAVTLVTGHADCMAFYAVDPVRRAVGLAHAGWRGALGGIGAALVARLRECFGCEPADLIAGIGPSICPACFEVGEDVADAFERAFPAADCRRPGRPGKAYVDLWRVAAAQFFEAGVLPERLSLMGVCTMEDGRLYSHRRDRGQTGGMAAYLGLLPCGPAGGCGAKEARQ